MGNRQYGLDNVQVITVHPHACGEQWQIRTIIRQTFGSSPRMWGTEVYCLSGFDVLRFIPTHVGNSLRYPAWQKPEPVHPHACGEQLATKLILWTFCGSSPRMWGTALSSPKERLRKRFIPTHVGNRLSHERYKPDTPVHPHACGEQEFVKSIYRTNGGSSPRMWGTDLAHRS